LQNLLSFLAYQGQQILRFQSVSKLKLEGGKVSACRIEIILLLKILLI